jgi:hypothetical protein
MLFLCSGRPALIYQVVWQRALFSIYGVNAESVAVVVSAFMLGLGLGRRLLLLFTYSPMVCVSSISSSSAIHPCRSPPRAGSTLSAVRGSTIAFFSIAPMRWLSIPSLIIFNSQTASTCRPSRLAWKDPTLCALSMAANGSSPITTWAGNGNSMFPSPGTDILRKFASRSALQAAKPWRRMFYACFSMWMTGSDSPFASGIWMGLTAM